MCPAAYTALLSSIRGGRLEFSQLVLVSVVNSCSVRELREPSIPLPLSLRREPTETLSKIAPTFHKSLIMRNIGCICIFLDL